jgi:BirA family transcriptional regulator, biotin operon repressor / biotin---[acetyl-CoA-carboxylase] ligase
MEDPRFSSTDVDRILAETFIEHVDYQREIASTNDHALMVAQEQFAGGPLLVLADQQTAGRGRGANSWWAADGALTFSVLIKPDKTSLPPSRWPQLALVAGLAIADAIEDVLGGAIEPRLKWPNDVYLSNRKACGILVETADGPSARLVFGIGINVNNRSDTAPSELQGKIIALCDLATRQLPLVEVLINVLQRLASRVSWIRSSENELQEHWRRRCMLTGRTVEVEAGPRRLIGTCIGIDVDGALLLDTANGRERCLSSIVTHWD